VGPENIEAGDVKYNGNEMARFHENLRMMNNRLTHDSCEAYAR
jgi:hypothetical protein